MITIPLQDGQLTQPRPEGSIASLNNGREVTFYFSIEELPQFLRDILYPPPEEPENV